MVKKIGVFITILGLLFLGIPQFNSKASMVMPVDDKIITIGSLHYQQGSSSELFNVGFSLPRFNTSEYFLGDLLNNLNEAFGYNNTLALYTIKQEVNANFEYRLLNSSYNTIEVMPKFDTIMFIADTNEMAILLNGNVVKYYNNAMGIAFLELVYTGIYDGNDYEAGYLSGYNDGLISGATSGYADGYSDARLELWQSRYDLGFIDARNDYAHYDDFSDTWLTADDWGSSQYNLGLHDGFIDGEAVGYDKGLIDGEAIGYDKGLIETDATGFTALLTTVFGGLGSLLAIEILPGIYIGAIIAVPLVFGIIFFILGKRKGD